jgi:hypothetical protein
MNASIRDGFAELTSEEIINVNTAQQCNCPSRCRPRDHRIGEQVESRLGDVDVYAEVPQREQESAGDMVHPESVCPAINYHPHDSYLWTLILHLILGL